MIKHLLINGILASTLVLTSGCAEEPAASAVQAPPAKPAAVPQTQPRGLPDLVDGPLRISPGGIEFGDVAPNSAHQAQMEIRNTGAQPISIVTVRPTCLCTTPDDLSGTVIPPGGSVPFSAGFEAPTETGTKTARIQLVYSAGGQSRAVTIYLRGEITMAVKSDPPYVDALKGVTHGEVRLTSVDGRPFRVLSSGGVAPVAEASTVHTLSWHVPARGTDNCPGARLWWVVETDHPDCPILPLRIRHECTGSLSDPARFDRKWTFKEPIVNLGAIAAGEPLETEVVLHNREGVPITGVISLSADATAELISTGAAKGETVSYQVRFTPRAGYQGMLYAMVLFQSPKGDKDVAFVARVLD
jgi:hypothetical protein